MKKQISPARILEIKALKAVSGIECANCESCEHIGTEGGGEDGPSYNICEINMGRCYFKNFPFKNEAKCWQPNFWFSTFADTVKRGTTREFRKAGRAFYRACKSVNNATIATRQERVKAFRCSRCGETPRKARFKPTGEKGLTCACRSYVVSKHRWWKEFALQERAFYDPYEGTPKTDELNRRYWSQPQSEIRVFVNQIHASRA